MQGRSIGSKRFNVGEAAPQPTRASIYQEENTPLEWTAAHDLRAQLALPQRPAALHPRALRHGLIASQLGLPMLARGEKKHAPDEWAQQPAAESVVPAQAHAAYSGAAEYAGGLDWSNNEQTTRYDEWELQKELVTYEETYPGYDTYDEYPRLDFQLPPVAAAHEAERGQRHELDYAQAAYAPAEYEDRAGAPGRHPYTQSAQPSAARWHSEQPIRRMPERAYSAEPRTASQGSFANPTHTNQARAARAAEPRPATQAGFATHAPLNGGFRGQAHVAPTLDTTQRGRAAQTHAGVAAHASQANAPTRAHLTQAQTPLATHTPQANAPTYRAFAAQTHAAPSAATTHAGFAARTHTAQAQAAPSTATTHAGFAARAHAPQAAATRSYAGAAGAGVRARTPRQTVQRAVRRYADDEPVVYPRGGSWLKRFVVLLALAGAGYAGQHYYFNNDHRAPVPVPTPPPPPAAVVAPVEPPAPPAAPVELTEAQAAQTSPESAKESRSAARAALVAERWRERRAGRRGRDDDNSGDDRDESTTRGRSYARATNERDSSSSRGRASTSASPRDDYADAARSDRDPGSERSRSSTSAHDDYVSDRHAAAQSGTLRINSLPWSQVHIDGQLIGHTPQMNLLLPAGKHRVTLVNSEMQLSRSLTVQITPGNITTHTINLAE